MNIINVHKIGVKGDAGFMARYLEDSPTPFYWKPQVTERISPLVIKLILSYGGGLSDTALLKVFAASLLLQTLCLCQRPLPHRPAGRAPSFEKFITEQKRGKVAAVAELPRPGAEVFFEARHYFSRCFSKGLSRLSSARWR